MREIPPELLGLWWREVEAIERACSAPRAVPLRERRLAARCGHGDDKACLALKLMASSPRLPEPLRAAARVTALILNRLETAALEAHVRGDREGLARLLLSLPPRLRRWWLGQEDSLAVRWVRELLGAEVAETLAKSRAEIKVVLTEEEVLRAVALWGPGWRERLRAAAREAVRAALGEG